MHRYKVLARDMRFLMFQSKLTNNTTYNTVNTTKSG